MLSLRAVLFDFDGTLVHLEASPTQMDELRRDLRVVFRKLGVESEFRPLYPELDRAFELAEREDMPQGREVGRRALEVIGRHELQFARDSTVSPFAVDAFRRCRRRWSVAIVSNNTRACIDLGLRKHGLVDSEGGPIVVGFEDVRRHKPSADGLVCAARRLGLTAADDALYVGDHVFDLDAGAAFNKLGIGRIVPACLQNGKCRWDDLRRHTAFREDTTLRDLSDLAPLIARLDLGGRPSPESG